MRALVTGAAGFIGSRLVRALCAAGHEVVAVDNLAATGSWAALGPAADLATLVCADVCSAGQLAALPFGDWDRVYHLAASFANERSIHDPQTDWTTNVIGTENVLRHCRDRNAGLVVYTSSSSCYGDLLPPFSEAAAMRPGTPYARSKLAGERRVLGSGLQYVILRLFNVYGPGDQPGRWRNAIPNMSVTLERTGRMLLFGAEATRDFTFIDDCIDVLLQADRAAGQIVNVGTGRETHMCDLADRIRRLMGLPSAPIDVRASRAWDRVQRRCAEVSRLRDRFGFVPDTPLEAGLRRTLAWLHSEGFLARAPQ